MARSTAPEDRRNGDVPCPLALVLACALILALTMGAVANGLSAFVVPLEAAHGWARREIALINTLGILGLAVGGLPMGALFDLTGGHEAAYGLAAVTGFAILLIVGTLLIWTRREYVRGRTRGGLGHA